MVGLNRNRDNYHVAVAAASGFLATAILGGLILLGSRRLSHFDAALVGYTFATLFVAFGITYRYVMWLQRLDRCPPYDFAQHLDSRSIRGFG